MDLQKVSYFNKYINSLRINYEEKEKIWHQLSLLKDELDLNLEIPCSEAYLPEGCAYGAPCMAGFSHLVIDPDQTVRPCDRLTNKRVGDISNSSIKSIWNSAAIYEIIDSPIPYCQVKNLN